MYFDEKIPMCSKIKSKYFGRASFLLEPNGLIKLVSTGILNRKKLQNARKPQIGI